MRFLSNTKIEFVNIRKIGYAISISLIAVSILSLIMHGGPKYNIDFTGGTLVHLKFNSDVEIQSLRSALAVEGQGEAEIKHFGGMNEISIRTMDEGNTEEEISIIIENLIEKALPDNPFVVQRVEKVGPKIGRELIFQALKAVFWSMLLILIYIMWRF